MTSPERPTRITPQTASVVGVLLMSPYEGWYGFDLAEAAGIRTGSIYPIMARLERLGWVESWWEDVNPADAGRPRRRFYRLTGNGRVYAPEVFAVERRVRLPAPTGLRAALEGTR